MPKTWIGWVILIVIGVAVWKHPANFGHDLNHAFTSAATVVASAFGG